MALAVVGAGVGRTGTMSLKLALEELGFGPCYHMAEIFHHHLLDHVPLWAEAAEGRAIDWNCVFLDYGSAVDFPASAFYKEISDFYPTSKVILTVRDPERWYESFAATIRQPLSMKLPPGLAQWGDMVNRAILQRVFDGDVSDRSRVLACYERHNAKVRHDIPAERLLVYDVAEGWEPLCRFLGVAQPDKAFPKVNTTREFQERIAPLFST